MGLLAEGFQKAAMSQYTLEQARDNVRSLLHQKDPRMFPFGQIGTSVVELAKVMLETEEKVTYYQNYCLQCEYVEPLLEYDQGYVLSSTNTQIKSTFDGFFKLEDSRREVCPECNNTMYSPIFYNDVPDILVFEYPDLNIKTSHKIKIKVNEELKTLYLRGIVYFDSYHFISYIISLEGNIWYHDGMIIKRNCVDEGHLKLMTSEKLLTCKNKTLTLAVYSQ